MKRPSRGILFLWTAAAVLLLSGAALADHAGASTSSDSAGAAPSAVMPPSAPGIAVVAQAQISPIGRDLDTPLADRARSLLGLLVLGLIA